MRKALFAFALAMIMAFGAIAPESAQAQAQSQEQEYRTDYKYSFFSNWSVGLAVDATKTTDFNDWKIGDGLDFGAQLRATKRIGKRWNLRYIADVPGVYRYFYEDDVNTFDNYAKLTSGISLNFLKSAYIFADAGVAFDADGGPTLKTKLESLLTGKGITPVGQAGLGLNFDFGKNGYNRVFVEAGMDCRPHYNPSLESTIPFEWVSNAFAYVGYTRNLGVTARDRLNIYELDQCPEEVTRLTEENIYLRSENIKCGSTTNELSQALNKATELNDRLEQELAECRSQKCEDDTPTEFQLYFEFGYAEPSESEEIRLAEIANQIKASDAQYAINGYSSTPGSDSANQKLSDKRANSVYDRLIQLGVDASQIVTVTGHGSTDQFGNQQMNQLVTITRK